MNRTRIRAEINGIPPTNHILNNGTKIPVSIVDNKYHIDLNKISDYRYLVLNKNIKYYIWLITAEIKLFKSSILKKI